MHVTESHNQLPYRSNRLLIMLCKTRPLACNEFMLIVEIGFNHMIPCCNARPLWEDLKQCKKPLLLIAGEKDAKFKEIAQQMCTEIGSSSREINNQGRNLCEMVIIPDCGHAVHLENPLPLINTVRKFLTKTNSADMLHLAE